MYNVSYVPFEQQSAIQGLRELYLTKFSFWSSNLHQIS